jgi:hypothetical protein
LWSAADVFRAATGIDDTAIAAEAAAAAIFFVNFIVNHPFVIKVVIIPPLYIYYTTTKGYNCENFVYFCYNFTKIGIIVNWQAVLLCILTVVMRKNKKVDINIL